jgi:hypothetical protein
MRFFLAIIRLASSFSGDTFHTARVWGLELGAEQEKRSQLDRLYQKVVDDLDKLITAAGLKIAAWYQRNENRILDVMIRITD